MPTKSSFTLFIIALLLASLACGGTAPLVPTTDPNAAQTAIVETIAAIQVQDTASAPPLTGASPTLAPTDTPSPTPTIEFTTTPE